MFQPASAIAPRPVSFASSREHPAPAMYDSPSDATLCSPASTAGANWVTSERERTLVLVWSLVGMVGNGGLAGFYDTSTSPMRTRMCERCRRSAPRALRTSCANALFDEHGASRNGSPEQDMLGGLPRMQELERELYEAEKRHHGPTGSIRQRSTFLNARPRLSPCRAFPPLARPPPSRGCTT